MKSSHIVVLVALIALAISATVVQVAVKVSTIVNVFVGR